MSEEQLAALKEELKRLAARVEKLERDLYWKSKEIEELRRKHGG